MEQIFQIYYLPSKHLSIICAKLCDRELQVECHTCTSSTQSNNKEKPINPSKFFVKK